MSLIKDILYINYHGYMRWEEPEEFNSEWVNFSSGNETGYDEPSLLSNQANQAKYTDQMLFLCEVVKNICQNTKNNDFIQLNNFLNEKIIFNLDDLINQLNSQKIFDTLCLKKECLESLAKLTTSDVYIPSLSNVTKEIKDAIDKRLPHRWNYKEHKAPSTPMFDILFGHPTNRVTDEFFEARENLIFYF